jgi:hypothetical protein
MEVPLGMAPLIGAIPQWLGLLLSLLSRSQFLAPKSCVANGSLKVERFPTCCRLTAVYSAGHMVRTNFGKFQKKIGTRANRT